MYTVYAIRVTLIGKVYFGSTKNYSVRCKTHRARLRNKKHHNMNLQVWYDLVGIAGLVFDVVASGLSREDAHKLEERLLRKVEALNIGLAAVGGDNLTRHPKSRDLVAKRAETQRRMIEKLTAAERVAIWGRSVELNGMYGRTHTPEVREILSKAQTGNSYATGYKWTPEQRQKLSEVASGRLGNLNPFFGKQHTDETKARLSRQRLGKLPANQRAVTCDGIVYRSATEAGRQLNVCTATIIFRIKSKHWNYDYA